MLKNLVILHLLVNCSSTLLIIFTAGHESLVNLCSISLINPHAIFNLSSISLCKHCQCHQPVTIICHIISDYCHYHMNGCHYLVKSMYVTVKLSHKDAITVVDVTSRYCHSSYHYQTNQSLTPKVSVCQIKSCHKSLNQSKLLNIPSYLQSNLNLLNHSSSHSTNSPMTCEWSTPTCR